MPPSKKHYVNNKDFYEALVKYNESLKSNPSTRIPDYIGKCILAICTRLATKPNFSGYSFKDELIADGIENCIVAINGFDPSKSVNPFAYFTQVSWNAFIRRISKEKKQQYIKHKNMQNNFSAHSEELSYGDTGSIIHAKSNDMSNDIISNFEDRLVKTQKKKAATGLEKFVES